MRTESWDNCHLLGGGLTLFIFLCAQEYTCEIKEGCWWFMLLIFDKKFVKNSLHTICMYETAETTLRGIPVDQISFHWDWGAAWHHCSFWGTARWEVDQLHTKLCIFYLNMHAWRDYWHSRGTGHKCSATVKFVAFTFLYWDDDEQW